MMKQGKCLFLIINNGAIWKPPNLYHDIDFQAHNHVELDFLLL